MDNFCWFISVNFNWRWFLSPIRYLGKYLGKDPNAGKDWKQEEKKTPKKVSFSSQDWNTKIGSQEIPGVVGKFCLAVQNETGQRLTENSSCLGLPRWYHLTLGRLLSLPGFPLLCYRMESLPCSKKGQSWVFISFSHRSLSCRIFSIWKPVCNMFCPDFQLFQAEV